MQYTLAFLAAFAAGVNALPAPQGVTADITPTGAAPSGCAPTYAGTFGIAVMNISATASGAAGVSQISDGQPQATSAVSQISDGQPQEPTGAPVSQISDGQPQAGTSTLPAVSQISDGQIQATSMMAVSQISDGQIQATFTAGAVSEITDGQPQAPTATAAPVSQISDGQPQEPTGTAVSQISDGQPQEPTGTAVSQISDGQPQQPTGTAASEISDGQPQATGAASTSSGTTMVACENPDTLSITLAGGKLTDAKGRTGYIAANNQFQFDGPPQAGALLTGGWSVCGNGTLALGGSTVFYQCLSGDFFNLYNANQGGQCNEVTINVLQLVDCSS